MKRVNILTHCNAGWLAFVDYGSATAPIYAARDAGIDVHVWVDETRPWNQGARLTSWELQQEGIANTLITDNARGHLMQQGHQPLLVAADLQRPNAVDQLKVVGEQAGVPVWAPEPGNGVGDPVAVARGGVQQATATVRDVVIVDTAGRLQNQQGLMDELAKVKRVVGRRDDTAPHEVMLVLDASQGQNALVQAQKFHDALGLTGITVTKLDGSAKGGILLAIASSLQVPVRFIGIGESAEDMQPFVAEEFAVVPLLFAVSPKVVEVGAIPVEIMRIVVDTAAHVAERVIEPLPIWHRFRRVAEMPLAHMGRCISGLL